MRTEVFIAQVTLQWDPAALANDGGTDPAQQLADGIAYLGECWFPPGGVTVEGAVTANPLETGPATGRSLAGGPPANLELRLVVPTDRLAWRDGQEDTDRLWLPVIVNGVPHHLDAFPVTVSADGLQHLTDGDDTDLDRLAELACADGPFDTVDIGGRPYVLLLSPHT